MDYTIPDAKDDVSSQQTTLKPKQYEELLVKAVDLELAHDTSSNELLWEKMGYALEMAGIKKTSISALMHKDIEDNLWKNRFSEHMARSEYKWHTGTYWLVTKKHGWTNPDMARHVLVPSKEQGNSSINTPNLDAIDILANTIEICRLAISKLKDHENFETAFDKKELREFYRQWRSIIKNCKYAFDEKTKIPRNTEQVLLECLAVGAGSLNMGAQKFMDFRCILLKQQGKLLTVKQANKFKNGGRQSQLPLLKPQTRDEAIFLDYYGVKCIKCDSWRVRPKADTSRKLECFDCDESFEGHTVSKCRYCQIPLYKERIAEIAKTGKCANCETEIELPQEML